MGLENDFKMDPILSSKDKFRKRKMPIVSKSMPGDKDRVVSRMGSQFVYTIMNYVNQECPYIAGHAQGPPANFTGPLVRFRENHGRRVINFAENVSYSMPVSEMVGRSYVELNLWDYLVYTYGEDKARDRLEAAKQAGAAASRTPAKKKRKEAAASSKSPAKEDSLEVGMINYGDEGRGFEAEVEVMKARYGALADWLVHLLKEKRGVDAPAAAPAAAGAP